MGWMALPCLSACLPACLRKQIDHFARDLGKGTIWSTKLHVGALLRCPRPTANPGSVSENPSMQRNPASR